MNENLEELINEEFIDEYELELNDTKKQREKKENKTIRKMMKK
jgi:hypothetical protein